MTEVQPSTIGQLRVDGDQKKETLPVREAQKS